MTEKDENKNYWAFLDYRKYIRWKGYTAGDRNIAIHHIETIINNFAYIIDFKFFSDMAVTFYIEIEERKVNSLFGSLKEFMTMDDFTAEESDSTREHTVLLNVTFTQGKGDLEIIVPEVPG